MRISSASAPSNPMNDRLRGGDRSRGPPPRRNNNNFRGNGRRAPPSGNNRREPRSKPTAEDLDADMDSYMGSAEN